MSQANTNTSSRPGLWEQLQIYRAFRNDPLGYLHKLTESGRQMPRFQIGRRSYVLLRNPDHIQKVLTTHWLEMPRADAARQIGVILGQGLVTTDGEPWKLHRRAAQSFFANADDAHGPMVRQCIDRCIQRRLDSPFPQKLNTTQLGFDIAITAAAKLVLGIDLDKDIDRIAEAAKQLGRFVMRRISAPVRLPLLLPTSRHLTFHAHKRQVDRLVYKAIAQARSDDAPESLAKHLVRQPQYRGEADAVLRDQLVTTFLAGFDTTAVAIATTLHHIGHDQSMQASIRTEVRATANNNITPLSGTKWLQAAVLETLRLFPPVPMFSRIPNTDVHVNDTTIREGEEAWVSPYVTHRDPAIWLEPNKFMPERWINVEHDPWQLREYLPFGKGPHACIGAAIAILEINTTVQSLLRKCRITSMNADVKPVAQIALGTKEDLYARCEPL